MALSLKSALMVASLVSGLYCASAVATDHSSLLARGEREGEFHSQGQHQREYQNTRRPNNQYHQDARAYQRGEENGASKNDANVIVVPNNNGNDQYQQDQPQPAFQDPYYPETTNPN